MSAVDNIADKDIDYVVADMSYLADGSFINRRFAAPGIEANTGRYENHQVKIRNARPFRDRFTLDAAGFTLIDHKSAVKNFYDNDEVGRIYPGEVVAAMKKLTGATSVATQGWMVRNSGDLSKFLKPKAGYSHHGGVQPPAADAHVDYLPDVADRNAKMIYERSFPNGPGYSRFIAGSFWRAFSKPPQDYPLALCDGRSVRADEGVRNVLIICDRLPSPEEMLADIPDEENKPAAAVFRYSPNHRWWYFPNMNRDEALFFKFHDSDRTKAWRTPHTAFRDPSVHTDHPRESVELRLVAYFE